MRWLVALAIWLDLAGIASARPQLDVAARAGNVTVYAEHGLEDTAQDLADEAAAALARIHADLADLPTPQVIEVRLVRDAKDLNAVAPPGRGAPAYAIGVAWPDLGIVAIALRRNSAVVDAIPTLRHELAHLALGAALGDRAPHWLHEGFAYQHSAEWSEQRVETLAGMAWLDSTIPLAELDRSFPDGELVAHRAYAESYDFVGFLSRRGRWDDASDEGDRYPFRRFLRELGQGVAMDQAAIHAYGRPIKALFDEWKEDLEKRYRLAPLGMLAFAAWIAVALLVVLAWWRRRRQNKKRIAQWEAEEAARRRAASQIIAPPYIPWPGEDPFEDEPEDEFPPPPSPRLLN